MEFWLGLEAPVVGEVPPGVREVPPGVRIRFLDESEPLTVVAERAKSRVGHCLAFDRPAIITDLSGEDPDLWRPLVQTVLLKCWELGVVRIRCNLHSHRSVFRELGFEAAESASSRSGQWIETAHALLNQGRKDEAMEAFAEAGSHALTERSKFVLMTLTSPNRLYWLDLSKFECMGEELGAVLTRRQILASARHQFECFGCKDTWIPDFLGEAVEGCSVGLVREGKVVACSLAGTPTFPSIWAISVDSELRQQGLGRGLLTHTLSCLKEAGHRTVVAHIREANLASIALFQKVGFQKVDKLEDVIRLGKTAGCLRESSLGYVPGLKKAEVEQACSEGGLEILRGI